MSEIISAAVLLILIMDPLGNLPIFMSVLKHTEPKRRRAIMIRELLIALLIAWGGTFIILLQSSLFLRLLGEKGVNALERLMGLILVMMATQMFLDGIRAWMKG